jgi:predicted RNase H-like nuclease (RuvC/YqgF family)
MSTTIAELPSAEALIAKLEGYNRQHQHDLMIKDARIAKLEAETAKLNKENVRLDAVNRLDKEHIMGLHRQIENLQHESKGFEARAVGYEALYWALKNTED